MATLSLLHDLCFDSTADCYFCLASSSSSCFGFCLDCDCQPSTLHGITITVQYDLWDDERAEDRRKEKMLKRKLETRYLSHSHLISHGL
jgi:hypothetical protein